MEKFSLAQYKKSQENALALLDMNRCIKPVDTISYIADKLGKPLSYVSVIRVIEHEKPARVNIFTLSDTYARGDYLLTIEIIEKIMRKHGVLNKNQWLQELLFSSYFKQSKNYRLYGKYEESIQLLTRLCDNKSSLIFSNMAMYYGALLDLSELYKLTNDYTASENKEKEAFELLNHQKQSKNINQLFEQLYEDNHQEVLVKAKSIAYDQLSNYQKGKYLYILAVAQKKQKEFGKAIKVFKLVEQELLDRKYGVLLKLTYEGLADCYSNLGDHKKAYEMVRKANSVHQ